MDYRSGDPEILSLLEETQTAEREKAKRIATNELMDEIVRRGIYNRDDDRADRSVLTICVGITAAILLFEVATCNVSTDYQRGGSVVKGAVERQIND